MKVPQFRTLVLRTRSGTTRHVADWRGEPNQVSDPGFELSPDEVAARFWQSGAADIWRDGGGRLDRIAAGWIADKLGGCDSDTMDEALAVIHNTIPR